jgi:hypothetical protein
MIGEHRVTFRKKRIGIVPEGHSFARLIGHTPRKLPAVAATFRFNAHQAPLLYHNYLEKSILFFCFSKIF